MKFNKLSILAFTSLTLAGAIAGLSAPLAQAADKPAESIIQISGGAALDNTSDSVRAALKTNPDTNFGTTIALTSRGKVYTWGSDKDGALGNSGNVNCAGDYDADCFVTKPLELTDRFDGQVIYVNAVSGYMTAITDKGNVYHWGRDTGGATAPTRDNRASHDGVIGLTNFTDNQEVYYSSDTLYVVNTADQNTGVVERDISVQLGDNRIASMSGSLIMTEKGGLYRIANGTLLDEATTALAQISTAGYGQVKQLGARASEFLTTTGHLGRVNDDNSIYWFSGAQNIDAIGRNDSGAPGELWVNSDGQLLTAQQMADGVQIATMASALSATPAPIMALSGDSGVITYVKTSEPNKVYTQTVDLSQTNFILTGEGKAVELSLGKAEKKAKTTADKQYQTVHRYITAQQIAIIVGVVIALIAGGVALVIVLRKK